jgi:hypothetical protein
MPASVPTFEEFEQFKREADAASAAASEAAEKALSAIASLAKRIDALEAGPVVPEPVTQKALFGYNLTTTASLTGLKATIGDPDVVRMFFSGTPGISSPVWALGKTVHISFKFDPTKTFPAATLRTFLASKPENTVAYVAVYHEPEDNVGRNEFTAAQFRTFVTATTAVCREFKNCYSTPTLMQWTLDSRSGRNIDDYLTGAEYDVIGWDVYPRAGTIGDIAAGLKSIHDESVKRGKPWVIGEVGAGSWIEGRSPLPSYSEAQRAQWMLKTVEQIKALPTQPKAVCWFLYPTDGAGFPLDSPETQAAMRQILA